MNPRNEVEITLNGKPRIMRPTFKTICDIERDIGIKFLPLVFEKAAKADIGMNDAAIIVFHGLKGNKDTRMSFEEVGEALFEGGVDSYLIPVTEFLTMSLRGIPSNAEPSDEGKEAGK